MKKNNQITLLKKMMKPIYLFISNFKEFYILFNINYILSFFFSF